MKPSHYVYTLAYPDGNVFYVGQGSKSRIMNHEADAANRDRLHTYNTRRSEIIRQIWRSHGKVRKEKVAFFENKEEARAFERELIASFPIGALVNARGVRKTQITLSVQSNNTLWLLVKQQRALLGKPELSQEDIVSRLIEDKWYEIEQGYQDGAKIAEEYIL